MNREIILWGLLVGNLLAMLSCALFLIFSRMRGHTTEKESSL